MDHSNHISSHETNPCTDVLSDEEYLIHMIPHIKLP